MTSLMETLHYTWAAWKWDWTMTLLMETLHYTWAAWHSETGQWPYWWKPCTTHGPHDTMAVDNDLIDGNPALYMGRMIQWDWTMTLLVETCTTHGLHDTMIVARLNNDFIDGNPALHKCHMTQWQWQGWKMTLLMETLHYTYDTMTLDNDLIDGNPALYMGHMTQWHWTMTVFMETLHYTCRLHDILTLVSLGNDIIDGNLALPSHNNLPSVLLSSLIRYSRFIIYLDISLASQQIIR